MKSRKPFFRRITAPYGALLMFGSAGLIAMVVALSASGSPSVRSVQTRHVPSTPSTTAAPGSPPASVDVTPMPEPVVTAAPKSADGSALSTQVAPVAPTLPPAAPELIPFPGATAPSPPSPRNHGKHGGENGGD